MVASLETAGQAQHQGKTRPSCPAIPRPAIGRRATGRQASVRRQAGSRHQPALCHEVSMPVDAKTVRRIAHLARIAVADDEIAELQTELNAMLAFVEQLAEVDVDGVEPMTSVTPMELKQREDK